MIFLHTYKTKDYTRTHFGSKQKNGSKQKTNFFNISHTAKLLYWLLLTAPLILFAETEMQPPSQPTANSGTEQIAEQIADADDDLPLKQPTQELRKGRLSTAFENFIPSETISADNAVPFPVDI
ncbi:MAG: hypothetical protein KUG79_10700 [Pseudomonadales bacterium]|nr:hypothetical protein [Pseudomonadales bacterium]